MLNNLMKKLPQMPLFMLLLLSTGCNNESEYDYFIDSIHYMSSAERNFLPFENGERVYATVTNDTAGVTFQDSASVGYEIFFFNISECDNFNEHRDHQMKKLTFFTGLRPLIMSWGGRNCIGSTIFPFRVQEPWLNEDFYPSVFTSEYAYAPDTMHIKPPRGYNDRSARYNVLVDTIQRRIWVRSDATVTEWEMLY